MKNRFFTILGVLLLITLLTAYGIYSYRNSIMQAQKINKQYEEYKNIEILGTELISMINKTIDTNIKNGVERDSNHYFVDNGDNTITIYIKFIYKNDTKTVQMEDLEKSGTEAFVKTYSTASFKCTEINYHTKTKNVKSLVFEEISENIS